jgi:hypothetical protein
VGARLASFNFFLSVVCAGSVIAAAEGSAGADYRITKGYGGFIEQYKLKYAAIRDRRDRVITEVFPTDYAGEASGFPFSTT